MRQEGVFFYTVADYSLPLKEVIREAQAVQVDQPDVKTPDGLAHLEQDGAYRVMFDGEPVMWIPDGAKRLQARLIAGEHMKEGGHPALRVTLARLWPYCV